MLRSISFPLIGAASVFLLTQQGAYAANINVSCPGGWATAGTQTVANDAATCINAQIASATAGDTLLFPAGTFDIQGSILVNKALTLKGAQADVLPTGVARAGGETKFRKVNNLQYGPSGAIFSVQSNDVTINGLEIGDGVTNGSGCNCTGALYGIAIPTEGKQNIHYAYNWIHLSAAGITAASQRTILFGQNYSGSAGYGNIQIDHNYLEAAGGTLVAFSGTTYTVSGFQVSNNVFRNSGGNAVQHWGGAPVDNFVFTDNTILGGSVTMPRILGGTVTGNFFNALVRNANLSVSIDGNGANPGLISGNTFQPSGGFSSYIYFWGGTGATRTTRDVAISNNKFASGSVIAFYEEGIDVATLTLHTNSFAEPVGTLNCALGTGALLYGPDAATAVGLDGENNWWGTSLGAINSYFCGTGITVDAEPHIVCYNNDPNYAGKPGFWPVACQAPVVSNTAVTPSVVAMTNTGTITVGARIDDTTKGGQNIQSAAFTVNGNPFVMAAGDGAFDEPMEDVTGSFTLASAGITAAGVYEVCVTGTDTDTKESAPECVMLAVYDPTAGFVTGGGWFTSAAGAFKPDPTLAGRAGFGIVSKYVKTKTGASELQGNTQFVFTAGALEFKSTAYEWLVVNQAGSNAQYKGVGLINGMGNYGFMLWAGDGTPDTFRIQIWDINQANAIVYDNGVNQPIEGGSIVVHVPKK